MKYTDNKAIRDALMTLAVHAGTRGFVAVFFDKDGNQMEFVTNSRKTVALLAMRQFVAKQTGNLVPGTERKH